MTANNIDLQNIEDRILFEDNHLLIINKLPSEIVQGDKTGDICLIDTVKQYIRKRYNKPGEVFVGLVHRIDRPVSGALVFAKTSKALSRLTVMVKDRNFSKHYLALAKNKPPKDVDTLQHYLCKNEQQNKSYVCNPDRKGAKLAELNYRILGKSDSFYLLEIELITGRHHQIRAQLAAIGCPIHGDLKYGYSRSKPDASISLHAYKVAFEHPVKKEPLCVFAPPPDIMPWKAFSNLISNG